MLNNRNTIAAIIVAISCFVFFSFVLTGYDNIKIAKTMLQERQDKLVERTALVAKVVELNAQYEENIDGIAKLDQLLPTSKHEDEITSTIQTFASEAGLVMTEFTLAPLPDTGKAYKSRLAVMQLAGPYEKFFNFLQITEQSLRLYDIQSIDISEPTGATTLSKGSLVYQIKIKTNSVK